MDLKGFGLQFPQEYAIACMEVICEIYPGEKPEEYLKTAKSLFEIMSIKMEDDTFIKPKRGVGLGYFSNIMSLVVASLLIDCEVVMMFNDDMLIPDKHYSKAREIFHDFDLIINEKKSGQIWHKVPMFANVSMARNGTLMYYEVQGIKAAVFNKRYHYERKAIHLAADWVYRWKQTFHYERIFGYESSKGESQRHPSMLGLNPDADYQVGWVKGGMLRNYISPKDSLNEEDRRIWAISFPWKSPKDREFSKVRSKAIEKYKDRIHYTEYDEYFNPRIKEKVDSNRIPADFFLAGYQLPRWSDLRSILFHQATTGRTTMGTYPKRAAYHMLSNLLSDNPIHSWITGGYEIVSPFYRIPGVDNTSLLLYSQLKRSTRLTLPTVNKTVGENAMSGLFAPGSGLEFMSKLGINTSGVIDIKISTELPPDEDYIDQEDLTYDLSEGEDIDTQFPNEDGYSSAGDFDAEELW